MLRAVRQINRTEEKAELKRQKALKKFIRKLEQQESKNTKRNKELVKKAVCHTSLNNVNR